MTNTYLTTVGNEMDTISASFAITTVQAPRQQACQMDAVGPTMRELHVAIENMSQGLCMIGADRRVILCNRRYAELYNLPARCIHPGMTLQELVDHRFAAGSFPALTRAEYLEWIENDLDSPDGESEVELRNGRVIAVRRRRLPDSGWVTTHDDITARRQAESRIVHMARHDGLTDLPNRSFFNECIGRAIAQAHRGRPFALFCLDLDGFKAVNDTFGHCVGDALLVGVAQRLRSCVRDVDTVARFGGDEFVIIQDQFENPNEAAATCRRIIGQIGAPFDVGGCHIGIGISVGIAVAPDDGMTADAVLRNADLALYLAKLDGRGTFRFFDPEMDSMAKLVAARNVTMRLGRN